MSNKLNMTLLKDRFGVCRLDENEAIPKWAVDSTFFSITKTMDELSVVCEQKRVPENIRCERDWFALKVEGPLDFSLVGILARISSILSKEEISIFAISTYDTDYILVKEKDVEKAINVLIKDGYEIAL
jgi:hypothetical protein